MYLKNVLIVLKVAILIFPAWLYAKNDTPQATADKIISVFEDWLKTHDIKAGSVAVSYNGKLIADSGVNQSADESAPVASLSKAITAICTIKALDMANKSVSISLGDVLGEDIAEYKAYDSRFENIRISQLLSQNSGIHKTYLSKQLPKLKSFSDENKQWQFKQVAARPLDASPGSGFHYANANYLILGIVIEQLTGQDYESYCREAVLLPINVDTARLDEDWRVLSSFGGWKISAKDYLKFIDTYFPANTVMGENPKDTEVKSETGYGAYYGLGTFMRPTKIGINFWHAGSWRWEDTKRNARFGAYFAAYDNGYTVSVNYAHDAWEGQQGELDTLLYKAAHSK